jgi:hypothetical protein
MPPGPRPASPPSPGSPLAPGEDRAHAEELLVVQEGLQTAEGELAGALEELDKVMLSSKLELLQALQAQAEADREIARAESQYRQIRGEWDAGGDVAHAIWMHGMRNLPEQLAKAGEWGRLQMSLTDLDYIEARCATKKMEVYHLIAELQTQNIFFKK